MNDSTGGPIFEDINSSFFTATNEQQEACSVDKNSKKMGKSNKPTLQIYRPPGLRGSGREDQTPNDESKPIWAAGQKQSTNQPITDNYLQKSEGSPKSYSPKSGNQSPSSAESSRPTSQSQVTSPMANGKQSNSPTPPPTQQKRGKPNFIIKDLPKKKTLTKKDIEDIKEMINELQLPNDNNLKSYCEGDFTSTDFAPSVAQMLVQSSIENGRKIKSVAKICSLLMESQSGQEFHHGLVTACWQYYECRDKLRSDHFNCWLTFLNFIADLYSTVGFTYEGELVDILFRVFDFMLRFPVLDTLKIEELECLISSLLSVGYDLERQCPDQLAQLRDAIRDALMQTHEPWARKMILLLVELSASDWKLPNEANDYYFQSASMAAYH